MGNWHHHIIWWISRLSFFLCHCVYRASQYILTPYCLSLSKVVTAKANTHSYNNWSSRMLTVSAGFHFHFSLTMSWLQHTTHCYIFKTRWAHHFQDSFIRVTVYVQLDQLPNPTELYLGLCIGIIVYRKWVTLKFQLCWGLLLLKLRALYKISYFPTTVVRLHVNIPY